LPDKAKHCLRKIIMPTIMAPLTPVQKAPAIIIRVSGVLSNILSLFNTKRALEPSRAIVGEYISPSGMRDEVLLTFFKAPASYTGEDVLEISFHGNPLIAAQAMEDMASLGVRMAEAGEFTRRAYMNGKMSLAQAEAVEAVISAKSAAGLSTAESALGGKLDERFYTLRGKLVRLLASLEADIDFAEDLDIDISHSVRAMAKELSELVSGYQAARMSIEGVRTVIAGAPNAGKSTLFNALLGQERAIVTAEAGTTRDILSEQAGIDGIILTLTDTAGLRESSSIAESEGIRRAEESIKAADLVIVAVDMSGGETDESRKALALAGEKAITVGTKGDLAQAAHCGYDVCLSCKSGEGVAELKSLLRAKAAGLTGKGGTGLVNERQYQECRLALAELEPILSGELSTDLTAFYLRKAAKSLDRLKGIDLTEETLDVLFSNFCIGK
jgi:tRNA modification GTPase